MLPDLSLAEWTVLALVAEVPTHGFAIARITDRNGELGRVWHIARPVVYRSMGRLEDLGLVAPVGDEPGQGPRRRLVAATPDGAEAVAAWLEQPVRHVRDVRSHLLTKLALLGRRGIDPGDLLTRQRSVLAPIADALVDGDAARSLDNGTGGSGGFDDTLAAWRRASSAAVLSFLDEMSGVPASAQREVGRQVGPLP